MTLQTSGPISFANIQTEYGGSTTNIKLSTYYRGSPYVPDNTNNINIPTSGPIALGEFYGESVANPISVTYQGATSGNSPSTSFTLNVGSPALPNAYNWTTSVGSLSSASVQEPTLSISGVANGATLSITTTCTVTVGIHTYSASENFSWTNTTPNETVSISGGGSVSGTASTGTSYGFTLTASGTPTTPSSYTWSTTAGYFNTTSGSVVVLTLFTTADNITTATVTCVMNVGGTNYTAQTTCTVVNKYCFSGCTRILTSEGYKRFDELPDEFYVINHTGIHKAKLLVHENSLEPMRRMGNHLVTERHLIKVGDNWVPASDLFHEPVPVEPRTVYNCHVLTEDTNDHHYLLENGLTVHNIKA